MEERQPRDADENEVPLRASDRPVFRVSRSEMEKRAAQAGSVVGKTVALFRDVRRRLKEPGQVHEDRLSELGATASARTRSAIDDFRRQAAEQTEKWRQAALEKTSDLRRQARDRYEQTRARAQELARDYPLHVVLAAGAAGFLLGVLLRIRRANRAG